MKGRQKQLDVLWYILISNTMQNIAHSIFTIDKTNTELVQYLNGLYFSPTPIIFLKSIKNGNFLIWTGLNIPKFLKRLLLIIVTALGHIGW